MNGFSKSNSAIRPMARESEKIKYDEVAPAIGVVLCFGIRSHLLGDLVALRAGEESDEQPTPIPFEDEAFPQ